MSTKEVATPQKGRDTREALVKHESVDSNQDAPTLVGSTPRATTPERPPISQNEQSPLLSPSSSENASEDGLVDDRTVWNETDHYEETKSFWHILALTISIGGLQLAWAVELSNGSPYLLSLGLSKSLMALVWIAGPLSGTLVQPYVGIKSDNCRISWGKRKPFMLVGAASTIVSLLCLAWTREIVGTVLGLFGADPASHGVKISTIVVAVLFVYILDFAINVVQAGIRALMVDCAPAHQQEIVNAMASRVTGAGNIVGYILGNINLPKYMWFFGHTQFQVLCVAASIALSTTVVLSCSLIKERNPQLEGPPRKDTGGVFSFFKSIYQSIRRLPPQTQKVCEVQFFSWIGWFGFLFYCSTWVGELWVQPYLIENPNMTPEEIDHLYEKATRVGTFTLLIWAIMSLTFNIIMPFFIAPTYEISMDSQSIRSQKSYTTAAERFMDRLVIPWLTLRRAWIIALVLYGFCMLSALFIQTSTVATIVVALVGYSWAIATWAPFAIISGEISKRDAIRRAQAASRQVIDPGDDNGDQAGVILGIHNVSIASPQVLATLGSSFIFKWLQKPRGTPGDRSMPVVMAVGGIFAFIAAWMVSRIEDDKELPPEIPARARRPRPISRGASFGGTLEY